MQPGAFQHEYDPAEQAAAPVNGATRKIPSGLVHFQFEGTDPPKVVSLKLRYTIGVLNGIAEQLNARAAEQGRPATQEEYLQAVADVLTRMTGVPIDIDEADALNDYLAVAVVELKKKASAALRSATSTDSTPSP